MSSQEAAKPIRKDAARNRTRLLAAAREIFAQHGLDASLDEIARHAGVGTGTVYRHFANKQDLAAEVLSAAGQQMIADAEAALLIEDPWQGLLFFCETTAARQAEDRGLYQALSGRGETELPGRLWPKVIEPVSQLVHHARQAKVIRDDAEAMDIAVIFALLGAAFELSTTTPDLWKRYLALLLDGLRAIDRPELPVAAPR